MYTINVKGAANPKQLSMVKLELVFFKTGYNRVPKVIDVTGEIKYWNEATQSFLSKKPQYVAANEALEKLKEKYKAVADAWEAEGKDWTPKQLSHHFTAKKSDDGKILKTNLSMEELINLIIKENSNRRRVKNSELVSSKNNGDNYVWLLNTIREFTSSKYQRKFSAYYPEEITKEFIEEYAQFLIKRGEKNGNGGGVRNKLKNLLAVLNRARKRGVLVDTEALFVGVRPLMDVEPKRPQTVSYAVIKLIENMDKSWMSNKERFWLDLFLFSFYAGGMSNVDVAHLRRGNLNPSSIVYERMKIPKKAEVVLTSKAMILLEKYKDEAYSDYVFPVFQPFHQTEKQKHDRVERLTIKVNKTLKKVTERLNIDTKITWYTARSAFITHMANSGFSPLSIAAQAGNSVRMIEQHYFALTEKDNIRASMEAVF